MTVQLSTLRVSAEMDASKYVAGAAAIKAADASLVQTHTQVDQKLSVVATGYEKLARQFVDGYGKAARYQQELVNLSRAIDKQGYDAQSVEKILAGLQSRYGMIGSSAQFAAKGQLEYAAAIEKVNMRLQTQQSQIHNMPANQNRPGFNANGFNSANVAFQLQDIAVTSAMGMNPLMIGLQQGTQIAGALGNQGAAGAVKTLAGAFASLLNPVSLAAVGLTAAGAAAIQYFSSSTEKSEKLNTQLQAQATLIQTVAARWGEAYPALKEYADQIERTNNLTQLQDAQTAAVTRRIKELVDPLNALTKTAPEMSRALRGITSPEGVAAAGGYLNTMTEIRTAIEAGKDPTDLLTKATSELTTLMNETGSDKVRSFAETFGVLASKIREAADDARAFRMQMPDLGTLGETWAENGRFFNSDQFIPTNIPRPESRPKIELEGLPGEVKDMKSAARSYQDVIQSAQDRIEQMRLEAQVSGETGVAADKLRFSLDLLQQAQEKGRTITEDQRAELARLADEYGRVAEAASRAKLGSDLQFEREQLFRSSGDQQIASRLRSSGRPVDLNSPEAQYMRQTAYATEIKGLATDFLTNFRNSVVQNGGNIGKAFGETLLNSVMSALTKAGDQAIDRIVNSLVGSLFGTGKDSGTGSGASAVTGIAGKIFGANDNIGKAPVTPVTRAALPDISASTDVASYITKAAMARGIDPQIALRVAKSEGGLNSWNLQSSYFKNGVQEPSYGPFQLYTGGGLGNDFMRKTGLDPRLAANGPAGVDFALDHAAQNGWGAWYGAAKVGVGKWDGIGGNRSMDAATAAASKFADATSDAAKGVNAFGDDLAKIGQLGSSYFPSAPGGGAGGGGGGGGLFGWVGRLFGAGLSSYGRSAMAASPQFASAWASGGLGLYADGTESAPGGIAMVGERGREIVNLPRGSQVIPNHRTESLLAAANNNRGGSGRGGAGVMNINIMGANGDEHVMKLVQQGVSQALAMSRTEMIGGGIADIQRQYATRTG